jgi:hypothetical protein
MTYDAWFNAHAEKHGAIVRKLLDKGYDKHAIIDYFDFDNMVEAEPDFCPLYAEKKKCHAMARLNCYLCACPNFRFSDGGIRTESGKTVYSECAIASKDGKAHIFADAVHQDCSSCTIPHVRDYIDKVFNTDWKTIMSACRRA